jgi:sulfite reductase alpha subunit-like flavoprotein
MATAPFPSSLPPSPPPLILYASETGTGEDVAFKIFHILSSSLISSASPSSPHEGRSPRISSIDDFNIESLPSEPFILFVISTTGDGEVPSAMKYFWKFLLQKNLPKNSLESLSYGIFGLGDSGYDKYNAAARYLSFSPLPFLLALRSPLGS